MPPLSGPSGRRLMRVVSTRPDSPMKRLPLLLILLIMPCLTGLRAQTFVQTVNFNETTSYTAVSGAVQHVSSSFFVGTFDPFDDALGTLTSFVIEWDLANTATGNLGGSGGSISLSVSGGLTFNGDLHRGGIVGADATGGPPFGAIALSAEIEETDTFLVSGSGVDYDSDYLTAVLGEETFSVGYTAPVNFSVSGAATFDAVSSGSVTLTYHYTAVPEPSTYAILGGFVALTAAVWHRRRSRAARTVTGPHQPL